MDFKKLNDEITKVFLSQESKPLTDIQAKAWLAACSDFRKKMNKYYSKPKFIRFFSRKPSFNKEWMGL